MKLSTSLFGITLVAAFLTVYMFDFGNAECDIVCTAQYAPVCGKRQNSGELKTFGNDCALTAANECGSGEKWVLLHQGEC